MDKWLEFERDIKKEHDLKYREYERLRAECPKSVKVGDRVLVAVGFLGHGFHWARREAEVMESVGDSSKIGWDCEDYKRCPTVYITKRWEYWVPNSLIVEVLPR